MTTRKQSIPMAGKPKLRCAVYTRKSSEEGLEMEFNSLDAQREASEAYVASRRAEGWLLVPDRFGDGGFSGGTPERPIVRRIDSGALLMLAVRMREDNDSVLDFHLLPTRQVLKPRLKASQAAIRSYRLTTVEAVADTIERKANAA